MRRLFLSVLLFLVPTPAHADTADALDAWAAAACQSGTRTLVLSAGTYRFSRPVAPFTCAILLQGEGRGATKLLRDFQGGALFTWAGGQDEGGGGVRDLTIQAAAGTYNGIAVYAVAKIEYDPAVNSTNPHRLLLDNVTIGRESGNASWGVGVYLDGSQNPAGRAGFAPGIRDAVLRNVSVSGAEQAVYLNHTYGVNMTPVDCYIPLPPLGDAVILHTTFGTFLLSRSCTLYIAVGTTAEWTVLNGQRMH